MADKVKENEQAYRHIFLSGEKKVGKSTLWEKVLINADINPSGFKTLAYEINGDFSGYCMHSLFDPPAGFRNDVPISVFMKEANHLGVQGTFDIFGAAILENTLSIEGFILMDELGRFERDALDFQKAVIACLDSHRHHILGVLQKTESPFLDGIKQREDVLLLTVTEENRDRLAIEVLDMVNGLK